MAYRVRLYAPTGAGINSLVVRNSSGTTLGTATPAGTSTACFDRSNLTTGITITPNLQSGVTVSMWVVNADGSVYYQYTNTCTIGYDSSISNLQIRLEVSGSPTYTYYVTVNYNANGGSGAPSSQTGSSTGSSQYVQLSIPYTEPTRSGYTFLGWALDNPSATTPGYYPGGTITLYGSTSGISYTLYAVWGQTTTGKVWIYTNSWRTAIPYIYTNTWRKCIPYIYTNTWRQSNG